MGRFPANLIRAAVLSVAALGFSITPATADDDIIQVSSSDDGHGLYSYTFYSVSTNYYFTMGPIGIHSSGITGTIQPPGWTPTFDTNGFIQWNYTNLYEPLTNAVTFSVQSIYPVPRLYNDYDGPITSHVAFLVLIVYGNPDQTDEFGGGYELFPYFGPSTNGAPTLSLQTVNTNLVIGWHAAAVGHVLETSTNLAVTNWTPLTNTVLIGHSNFVTVPKLRVPQFFRTRSTNAP